MENVHVLLLFFTVLCIGLQLVTGTGTPPVRAAKCKECMFCQLDGQKMSPAVIKTETNLALAECANRCIAEPTCNSVTYKTATKECNLYKETSSGNIAAEVGTEYWGYDKCIPAPTYTCT